MSHKMICVMDTSGRYLVGDIPETQLLDENDVTLVLENVILFESMLAPSGANQIGVINITRPLIQGSAPLPSVFVKPTVWFEISSNTPFYTFINEERQRIRAAAAGIVTPKLVVDNTEVEK